MRRQLLVTGAAGGMGKAVCRLMGASHELVMTDIDGGALEAFAEDLRDDGYVLGGVHAGALGDASVLAAIAGSLDRGPPLVLVHCAGVSGMKADWRTVLEVNVVATERLLRMVEGELAPGSVAVLIASAAGHAVPNRGEMIDVLDNPLAPGFIDAAGALIAATVARSGRMTAGRIAYGYSKRAVMRMCSRRAMAWGRMGARIVSVSPGTIMTPMSRFDLAHNPENAENVRRSPSGRPGSTMDIAQAVRFLASEDAEFISGCDLLVDGGMMGAMSFDRPRTSGKAAGE